MYFIFSPVKPFKPKSDFHKQILAHIDDVPKKCQAVPSGSHEVDYDTLTGEQVDYYIWWRECLRNGRVDSDDKGYAFLRMVEIANGTDTLDSAMEQINLLYAHKVVDMITWNNFLADLCVVNNIDLPDHMTRGPLYKAFLSAALSYPPRELSSGEMQWISGYPDIYLRDEDSVTKLFNDSLYEIDKNLLETTGKDLFAGYSKKSTMKYTPFDLYYPEKSVCYYVEYDEYDDRLSDLMKALLVYCAKKVDPDERGRVSSILTKDMRKVVDTVFLKGHVQRDPVEKEWKGYRLIPESEYVSPIPLVRSLPDSMYSYKDPKDLRRSIRDNKYAVSDGPHPYVMCYCRKPSHIGMTPNQRSFYLYFRDCAREGKFIDTDEGYMWLLLVDLINNNYENSLETIIGIRDAYFPGTNRTLPGLTAVEYAMFMGLDIPDDSLYPNYTEYTYIMTQILEGRDGYLSADGLMSIGDINNKTLKSDLDESCVDIVNIVIRRINDELSKGILSECRLKARTEKLYLFSDLKHYREGTRAYTYPIDLVNYYSNSRFTSGIEAILRTVVQAMRAKRQNKKPSFTNYNAFGMDIRGIVMDVAEQYLSRESSVRMPKSDVHINRDAVEKAQNDLEDVTRMMAIDEGIVEQTIKEEIPEKIVGGDPWHSLMSSLTDEEGSYLQTLAEGGSDARKSSKIVNSINSKAMDTVGDTLIDDDGLLEDYVGNVRSMLESGDDRLVFIDSLTGDEKKYLIALVSDSKPKGRKPINRIQSINDKSLRILGEEMIVDGSVVEERLDWIRSLES